MAKKKAGKKKASRKKTSGKKAAKKAKPRENERDLMIVPVRNMILFPGVVLPLMVGRERSIVAIQTAVQGGQEVGLLLQIDEQMETPGIDDLYEVGTVAEIVRYWTAPDGPRRRHGEACGHAGSTRACRSCSAIPTFQPTVYLNKS